MDGFKKYIWYKFLNASVYIYAIFSASFHHEEFKISKLFKLLHIYCLWLHWKVYQSYMVHHCHFWNVLTQTF